VSAPRVSDERLARVIALQIECAKDGAKETLADQIALDLRDARQEIAELQAWIRKWGVSESQATAIANAEVRGATWALEGREVSDRGKCDLITQTCLAKEAADYFEKARAR